MEEGEEKWDVQQLKKSKKKGKKALVFIVILLLVASFLGGCYVNDIYHKEKASENENDGILEHYYIKCMNEKTQITVCLSFETDHSGYVSFILDDDYVRGYMCGENIVGTHFAHESGNLVLYYVLLDITAEDVENLKVEETASTVTPIKV